MKVEKVPGANKKHKVLVYALSTCAWCKKTKRFLQDKGIEYEFVDVDLCEDKDMDAIREDLKKRGLGMNFPVVIVGFQASSPELQREQFILVNKTKPLPRDLLNELLPHIQASQLPKPWQLRQTAGSELM